MADDSLVLTIRIHDPKEKNDSKKAAVWVAAKVDRADATGTLTEAQFNEKYIAPVLAKLTNLKFLSK